MTRLKSKFAEGSSQLLTDWFDLGQLKTGKETFDTLRGYDIFVILSHDRGVVSKFFANLGHALYQTETDI